MMGTGAALTYRAYVRSPRGGELPIIGADNSATKWSRPSLMVLPPSP